MHQIVKQVAFILQLARLSFTRTEHSLEPGGIHNSIMIVSLFPTSDERLKQRLERPELEPAEFAFVVKVIASVGEIAAVVKHAYTA